MKFATRTLVVIAALGLFCSTSTAKVFRKTLRNNNTLSVDVNGNLANGSDPNVSRRIIKGIKFSRSGIIINRVKYRKALNESGRRTVFRNLSDILVYDPEFDTIRASPITRNRFVFPRGRERRLMLMVTARLIILDELEDEL